MKVIPLYDRILVKRVEAAEVTKGGIIIPGMAKEKPLEAVVVAVGSGKRLKNGIVIEPDVEIGDTIFFGKYSGFEMEIDGEPYTMIRDNDVLCKIKEEKECNQCC